MLPRNQLLQVVSLALFVIEITLRWKIWKFRTFILSLIKPSRYGNQYETYFLLFSGLGSTQQVFWLVSLEYASWGLKNLQEIDLGIWRDLWEVKFKNYLSCKTITSQNLSSEAQVKSSLFHRMVMVCSQDI